MYAVRFARDGYRYHGDNDVRGMMDVLLPLHETLERGAETDKEENFQVHPQRLGGVARARGAPWVAARPGSSCPGDWARGAGVARRRAR